MKTKSILAILMLSFSLHIFADPPKKTEKKPILNTRKTNPNFDPNKGVLGKPKEERVIKRNRDEPIIKNRRYEPKRLENDKKK